MRTAIGETDRRRAIQVAYNEEHGITPETISKGISDIVRLPGDRVEGARRAQAPPQAPRRACPPEEIRRTMVELEEEMLAAADDLRFEYAAKLRDEIKSLRRELDEAEAERRRNRNAKRKVFALRTQVCRMQGVSRALREVSRGDGRRAMLLLACSHRTANAAKRRGHHPQRHADAHGREEHRHHDEAAERRQAAQVRDRPVQRSSPGQNEIGYAPITRQAAGRRLHHADAARTSST